MKRYWIAALLVIAMTVLVSGSILAAWEPPVSITKEEAIAASNEVLGLPDIPITETEQIFRINVAGLDWDIQCVVYEPKDPTKVPVGPDGRKVGMFLFHGGSSDWRGMEGVARLLSTKFGYKCTSMTYPGRLNFQDPTRNWTGDTVNPDGTVRTPQWTQDMKIGKDQYTIVYDQSKRPRYGTLIMAEAKEGTEFYYRMASWPLAYEESMREVCARFFPVDEYSIYINGHSTGGPYTQMLTQRVPNIVGVTGIESSPFGYVWSKCVGQVWDAPFYQLRIRTWRDSARYLGPEALVKEGPTALNRLPMLMEEVFEDWEKGIWEPNIKCEDLIQYNGLKVLEEAARVTAKRLGYSAEETEALVQHYLGLTRELSGPGVKPVPPQLLAITQASRDHNLNAYTNILVPMYKAMNPAPKIAVFQYKTGQHGYGQAEEGLPMGLIPSVAKIWHDAIENGWYAEYSAQYGR